MLGTNANLGITTPQPMPNPTPGGLFWVEGFPPQELTDAGWVPWTGEDPLQAEIRQLQIQYVTTTQMLCGLLNPPIDPPVNILTREQIANGIQSITDPLTLGHANTLEGWLIYIDSNLREKTNTTTIDDAMKGYQP